MFSEFLAQITPGKIWMAQVVLQAMQESFLHLLQKRRRLPAVNEMMYSQVFY